MQSFILVGLIVFTLNGCCVFSNSMWSITFNNIVGAHQPAVSCSNQRLNYAAGLEGGGPKFGPSKATIDAVFIEFGYTAK